MDLPVKEISLSEFATLEAQMRASHLGVADMQKTWNSLHTSFMNSTVEEENKYRYTFFRVYTELSFRMIDTFEKNFIIRMFAHQIPVAFAINVDVWEKLMWYLGTRLVDPAQMGGVYMQVRESFLTSRALVGFDKEKPVIVSDVVAQIQALDQKNADSIVRAEFMARLRDTVYPKNPEEQKYFYSSPDEVVDKFVGLINFFLGVKAERINFIVDAFLYPENYDNSPPAVIPLPAGVEPVFDGKIEDVPEETSPEEGSPKSEEERLPTYKEIQSIIDSEFEKDETGQYKDIEGVFQILEEMAEQFQDEKIKELLYFDENSGGFVWTEV